MQYPLPELLDRLSIEKLKEERIPNYKSEYPLEMFYIFDCETSIGDAKFYTSNYGIPSIITHRLTTYMDALFEWNGKIWDLESDIRKGKEGELGLEEVGRRAIQIRELNNERIKVKNEIAKQFGGFKEVKHNHASE